MYDKNNKKPFDIFLSHRIDFLTPKEAKSTLKKYNECLEHLDINIISMATEIAHEDSNTTDTEIVQKCLETIKKCKLLIFDCSEENWNYIGCIFEVVYAHQLGIPIFTYTGQTTNYNRPWLRYHSSIITPSADAIKENVEKIMLENVGD